MALRPSARVCASESNRRLRAHAMHARRSPSRLSQAAFIAVILVTARTAASQTLEPPPLLRLPSGQVTEQASSIPAHERLPLVPRQAANVSPEGSPERSPVATLKGAADSGAEGESKGFALSIWEKLEIVPIAVLVGSLGVIAILLRAIAARSSRGASRPEGVIEIMARYPVGRGQQIVLMRVGRRMLAVHQADRSMRTLMEANDPDEVAELIAKARTSGGDLFARLLDRKERELDPFAEAEMVDLTREASAQRTVRTPETTRPRGQLR